jgi:Ca-activated chloride channel family protein
LTEHFQFAYPHLLWLLLLLPLLGFLRGGRGRAPSVKMGSLMFFRGIGSAPRNALTSWWPLWTMLPLAGCIVALARPQTVRTEEKIQDSGIEIIVSLDISLSMAIEDFRIGGEKVNRLTVAKNVIRNFAAERRSDRIGLVAFAGRPYVASPLTMDQEWFRKSLERVTFNVVEDGTAIGSSLLTAVTRLDRRKEAKSKIILLLTDGANNSGSISPQDAAKIAKTLGIKIYTVAIGTPGKHNIPLTNRMGIMPGIRQEFDEPTLQQVAQITDGRFYKGQDTEAVQKIFEEIDQLEKTKLKVKRHLQVDELFAYPLAGALLAAVLGVLLYQVFGRRYPS